MLARTREGDEAEEVEAAANGHPGDQREHGYERPRHGGPDERGHRVAEDDPVPVRGGEHEPPGEAVLEVASDGESSKSAAHRDGLQQRPDAGAAGLRAAQADEDAGASSSSRRRSVRGTECGALVEPGARPYPARRDLHSSIGARASRSPAHRSSVSPLAPATQLAAASSTARCLLLVQPSSDRFDHQRFRPPPSGQLLVAEPVRPGGDERAEPLPALDSAPVRSSSAYAFTTVAGLIPDRARARGPRAGDRPRAGGPKRSGARPGP